MDTGKDSAEGEEKIREGEGLERKKGKKTITIKILKSKEDFFNISRGQKRKHFEAKKEKHGIEVEEVEGDLN